MSEQERPPILTDEHIIERGRNAFPRYIYEAQNSNVPESFLRISRAISMDYFQELSPVEVGQIVLETKFEDDRKAWLALKYAEAISAIKQFESKLDYDAEGPIIFRKELTRLELRVGFAAVIEPDNEEAEEVKIMVEDYFRTNPMASSRLEYIEKQVRETFIRP